MAENVVAQVWLSYFGEARPDYYGIEYNGLDSFPPRLMNPEARSYVPHDPAPGIYAISATNLQGVHFANPDQFAYFREQEPIAKIGYSLFLYDVPAKGGQVDLLLAGIQPDEIRPQDFDQFNSNDVLPRWFDSEIALIMPNSRWRWLVLSKDTAVSPIMQAFIQSWPQRVERDEYIIYRVPDLTLPDSEPIALFHHENGEVGLMTMQMSTAVPGQSLLISTGWQQKSTPQPLKIFVHLVDGNGQIVAQWDGLGAAWEGWHAGDALLLTHLIPLPADLAAGSYHLRAGIYQPETAVRWQTAVGDDYVNLGTVQIGE
jgi:hypothetical protein